MQGHRPGEAARGQGHGQDGRGETDRPGGGGLAALGQGGGLTVGARQGLGQHQGADDPQHLVVAHVLQGEVQEQQQQAHAHQGHSHRPGEGDEQAGQDGHLKGADLGEVGGRPLADVGETRHVHQVQREEQGVETVRADQWHGRGGQAEAAPAQHDGPAPGGPGAQQGLQGEGTDQRQAEEEAAVQVGPERHQRQEPPAGRAVLGPGPDQFGGPELKDRHRQDVRPRQQAAGPQKEAEHQQGHPRQAGEPAAEVAGEQPGGEPHGGGGEQHHAAPAGKAERPAQQHLGQPLVGEPGRAVEGRREGIGPQHRALGEHHPAGADVPEGVAVVQDPGRQRHQPGQQGRQRRQQAGEGRVRSRGRRRFGHGASFGHVRERSVYA